MDRKLKFTEAIREATDQMLGKYPEVFQIGLGTTYKSAADGTLNGLAEKYPNRVYDMPCSENTATGFCIGAARAGKRPILHHGRVEFALFGADQIITQAAKWNYMFGGDKPVPITIRAAIGRAWGNGPQHTQVLHSLFGHIPGLKVVVPSSPYMAKALLIASVLDDNPVIYMEPRWLYNTEESVPGECYDWPIGQARHIKHGKDVTIVCVGDMVLEAKRCYSVLRSNGIEPDIIDLVSINPIDYKTIFESVNKTNRLIVCNTDTESYGVGKEIISTVCEAMYDNLASYPINISCPNSPCPTASSLTEGYYPTAHNIVNAINFFFGKNIIYNEPSDFMQRHMPPSEDMDVW